MQDKLQELWRQLAKIPPLYAGIAAALVLVVGLGGYFALRGDSHPPSAKMQALKEALDDGVITKDEYAAKVAQLASAERSSGGDNAAGTAPSSSSAAEKMDALNQALDSGLITQDEYNAKVAQLTAQASAAPSGAPASPSASGQFRTADGQNGGRLIVGQMGALSDPGAAAAAILRKVHDELGAKPEIVQAMTDPSTNSATFVFTAQQNGQTIVGIGFANAPPGDNATGYAVYDTAQRFRSSSGALLARLGGGGGGEATQIAPPEQMMHHEFSDGTGSIDVPEDWRLTTASGGTATALGPTGELVAYNLDMNAMDPNNRMAVNYLRSLPPQTYQYTVRTNVMLSPVADPARAWQALYTQRAAQNGTRAPVFNIKQEQPIELPQGGVQSQNAFISGDATVPSPNGDQTGKFSAFVQIMPPNNLGQWSMISTWTFVSDREFARYAQTTAAILSSVRINFGAVNAQGAATRQMFQRQFETMIATAQQEDRDRKQRSDDFLAGMAIHEDNMQKQATAMINFAGDREVIRNDVTGEHFVVDNGFSSDWIRANPNYHVLAPSELVNGVDY